MTSRFKILFFFFSLFVIFNSGSFNLAAADKESISIPFTQGFVSYGNDINNTSSDSVTENNENQRSQQNENRRVKNLITYQMIFSTLALAFGLIHLILFLFFKKAKENLYFAIFLFFYSASIFFDYQNTLYAEIEQTLIYVRIHRAIQPFYLLFALRFVYSLFYLRVLKRFWFFVPLLLVFGAYAVYSPHGNAGYKYFSLVTIPLTIEIFRVIANALWKKRKGAWIIATGFFIYYFFSSFDTLMDLKIRVPFIEMENPYALGTIGFLLTMSIYLARSYSQTYQKMLEQERQIREKEIKQHLLEAENARKTQELEEARKLQLSMLPECVTELPGIDICFYMEPATEVGGDYYDYLIDKEGNLVLVIGDATGHGMKAGIMVATIKSLFQSSGTQPDISAFFNQCTSTIKKMNMGNLYMALALFRLKDNKLMAASAGMPHILIFRKAKQSIDEIKTKGPPLGGFSDFSYQQKETKLNSGDTVLLMSDGFSEQFNEKDDMMGYDRVKDIFKRVANMTPSDIVDHLIDKSKKWRNLRAQDDDITFVVLKVK